MSDTNDIHEAALAFNEALHEAALTAAREALKGLSPSGGWSTATTIANRILDTNRVESFEVRSQVFDVVARNTFKYFAEACVAVGVSKKAQKWNAFSSAASTMRKALKYGHYATGMGKSKCEALSKAADEATITTADLIATPWNAHPTSPDVFSLIHASAQGADSPVDAPTDETETPADTQQLQQELAAVQQTLKTMQAELDAIKRELALLAQPAPRSGDTPASAAGEPMPSPAPPGHSLKAVVAWLAQHDRMTRPALRARLLPLDLLPNSVMEEINEKALDLTGVLALEDAGDEIIVAQDILAEVLADWDQGPR